MAKIEYEVERTETIELPNCFCGEEPELVDDYDDVGDHRYRWVVVECPYCHAHANEGRGWNTFKARSAAVREAAEDWIKLIRRDDE